MAQIIVAGLGEGQDIHLVRSRPIEWEIKAGEYIHKDKNGKSIAFRKRLATKENGSPKPITDLTINRLIVKEWDNPKGKSWTYSLVITSPTGSHRLDIGSGMLGTSVANTLMSLTNFSKEEIAAMKFTIAFYRNNKGYNTAYITYNNWETLDWFMSPEEQAEYVRKAPNSLDPNKMDVDRSWLHRHMIELAELLNPLLPRSSADQWSALDGIDDDEDIVAATPEDADSMFGTSTTPEVTLVTPAKAPAPSPVQGQGVAPAPAGSFEV